MAMRLPKRINKFRKYRVQLKLTRHDVATQAGISEGYIEKIENDVIIPGRNTLIKLCKLYNCKIDDILEA